MQIGDIKISTLKIGDIDLTNYNQATYAGFNVFEDILNPYGPVCDIQVVDHSDALGKTKMNGSYDKDIEIKFTLASGNSNEQAAFKFKFFQNKNLKDGALKTQGSNHSKQYNIRGVSMEMLNAQGNYVQKSYEELTSKMVEDILKKNFKTDKSIEMPDTTKGKRRFVFSNEHPLSALKKLNSEHVSSQNKSSCYVCFQKSEGGNQKYVFATFEHLFKQSSIVTLKQSASLNYAGTTETDKQNSIMWINVADSFFTPTRALNKPNQVTYNMTTGEVSNGTPEGESYNFADGKSASSGVSGKAPSNAKGVPNNTINDSVNNKEQTYISEARKNKTDFLSHLAQNYGTLEIPGNPKIKLGSMITLDIPKKADSGNAAGETQFNGKALVVSIRHKIKPIGQTPRYTMILGVVKGSYKEGGGGNG